MSFESALKIASLELPNFNGTVLRRSSKLSILGVKGNCSNAAFVSLKLKLRRSFGNIKILNVCVVDSFFVGSCRYLFLKIFDFLLKVIDLFLKSEDGLPFDLELIPLWVNIYQTHRYLLCKFLSRGHVVIFDEVFE